MHGTEKALGSDDMVDIGEEHHRTGRLQEAESYYRKALEIDPGHPGALYFLANIAYDDGRLSLATQLSEDLLRDEPNDAEAWHLLGMVARKEENFSKMVECLNKALALQPTFVRAYVILGDALSAQGELSAALANYDKALGLKPDFAEAYIKRGNVLFSIGRRDEALASYDEAIVIEPDFAQAHFMRGNALMEFKQLDEALASYDKAIEFKPGYAEACFMRGNALRDLDRLEGALVSYDQAIAFNPDYREAHVLRGIVLKEMEKRGPAREAFERALQLNPDYYQARWNLGLIDIPAICRSSDEIETSREAFRQALCDLDKWFDSSRLNGAEKAIVAALPFYLAYQEENNRDLLSNYGRLTRRLMEHWQNANNIHSKCQAGSEKIKIGLVSSHIRSHPVWDAILRGWLLNFDSTKFEWHIFSLGAIRDTQTELARSKASSFVEECGSLKAWASSIVESRVEVLIYPEIGMDELTIQLANLRLAPLQIAAWGHPETTGLETMDCYLSSDLFEPEGSEFNYTESLIKLPHLGCTYTPHPVMRSDIDLSALGINKNQPLLLCPGTPFKYAPAHDDVFPQIARELDKCVFVFFDRNPYWTALLKSRLRTVFENSNLIMDDYVKFIPWLSRESFYALLRRADVFMDTIGFSGFNTAMQAIECSLPVVTMDGRFMRGRLASGVLKRLDVNELICNSEATYCEVVVRLVKDREFRDQIVNKINSRQAILYDDMEPMRALEKLLLNKCRPAMAV